MISFDRVSFSYEEGTAVLKDLNLAIKQGEFVCILGANGSGKSTLVKHINALLLPDEGAVTCAGIVLSKNITAEELFTVRKAVGMIFQNPDNQIVSSIVEEDVAFGPENIGIRNPELRARVDRALKRVGLSELATHATASLSGGQKQRLALAGVLALEPKILVFDEASAMLDPQGRREFLTLCTELHQNGFTIVMTTHFMEDAALAQRVVILKEGTIAAQGIPPEILVQESLLSSLNLEMPFAARCSQALNRRGVSIPLTLTTNALKEELRCLASKK